MCEIAREILTGEFSVARVIARPFIGEPGSFERTSNRKDYSLEPPEKTVLDYALEAGNDVIGIGKIHDIFNGKGISKEIPSKSNLEGIKKTISALESDSKGIIFTNLVDFDAKYGHRRDVEGYKSALEEVNHHLPDLLKALKQDDLLIITADHGNDPSYEGTDHTREYIPLLIYGSMIIPGVNIGTRNSFADIGATISEMLNIDRTPYGKSFASLILK